MTRAFGKPSEFQIVIGDPDPTSDHSNGPYMRNVEIYAAGRWLTCDDNRTFPYTLALHLGSIINRLLMDDNLRFPYEGLSKEDTHRRLLQGVDDNAWGYRFLDCGEITDNIHSYVFRRGRDVVLTFSFWRDSHPYPDELGKVFVTEIPERELLLILHQAEIALLQC